MPSHTRSVPRRTKIQRSLLGATCAAALLIAGGARTLPAAPKARTNMVKPAIPTRSLYTYHRDDSTANHVTQIKINAAHMGTTPLSQLVFGNFVENLGTVIYDILWADMLHNPNLEMIAKTDHEAQWWDQTGMAIWLSNDKNDAGYLSPRAVQLAAPDGTLSQRVFLPAYRCRKYTLTFWTRAQSGAGQITAQVRTGGEEDGPFQPGEERAGKAIVQSKISVNSASWSKQTIHWNIPNGALPKGQAGRFVILHSGGAAVDVDQIRLFPDDNVDGMDPDVLKLAKAWNIPVLRMAGNYSSGYHWKDGIGPRDARPTTRNVAWGGVDSHAFGTEEFLDLAKRIGAVPQIGANAGDGTAEEAAEWVAYCNGQTERVPIWEIGNELYGGWQIGHTDAPGNASRFVEFRNAMLKADPRIKIIATGQGDLYTGDGLKRETTWNTDLLQAAAAHGGQLPDWLSIHPLVGLPNIAGGEGVPYDQIWASAMAHPYWMDQTLFPMLANTIESVEGPQARTRIAPTEWGIIVGGDGWDRFPNHNVEAGAIYNGLALNAFLRNGDWVTLANMTALLHGGCIAKSHGVPFVHPEYYTEQLYADAAPRTPIETTWTGPGLDVPQRGGLPAVKDVPDVDVFSALNAAHSKLTVFLVNRNLADERPVQISAAGFQAGKVSATIIDAKNAQAGNSWDHPDNVKPKSFAIPGASADGWSFTLPAHSLVVFTAAKGK